MTSNTTTVKGSTARRRASTANKSPAEASAATASCSSTASGTTGAPKRRANSASVFGRRLARGPGLRSTPARRRSSLRAARRRRSLRRAARRKRRPKANREHDARHRPHRSRRTRDDARQRRARTRHTGKSRPREGRGTRSFCFCFLWGGSLRPRQHKSGEARKHQRAHTMMRGARKSHETMTETQKPPKKDTYRKGREREAMGSKKHHGTTVRVIRAHEVEERGDTMRGATVHISGARSNEAQWRGRGSRRRDELFGTARGEAGAGQKK